MKRTIVSIGLTFAEASAIQERLETLGAGPVRDVLARVLREYVFNAGAPRRERACMCHADEDSQKKTKATK